MSKFQKLHQEISKGKVVLGIGPMSWNCIDAVIEVANEQKIPIKLIASRRQVESNILGGGYVTTTETLTKYIKENDVGEYVFLARDHGGPWQGTDESNLGYEEAMRNAASSYWSDIENGFDIIHIDPSMKPRSVDEIIVDVEKLHSLCERLNKNIDKKEILYECGTEEHSGQITDPKSFEKFVKQIKNLRGMQFAVGNMGYWVKEVENVGSLNETNAKAFVRICNDHGLYLKGHNSDYLSNQQLQQYNNLGVHSINVAPELGICETKGLLSQLELNRKSNLTKKFVDIAVKSDKWKKWMKSDKRRVSKLYKAKICGHYIFNDPEVKSIKKEGRIDDKELKKKLKTRIIFILSSLGWKIK